MSQKRRVNLDGKNIDMKTPRKKKNLFYRGNISKIIFPSLFLISILFTPILFEAFNVRHQRIIDVIDAPVPGTWYDDLFNGGSPIGNIDPDVNYNGTNGFMDGFTNGLSNPERELFRYANPSSTLLYWRLEVYDIYTMFTWEKNTNTNSYSGYMSLPGYADGEFSVSTDQMYSGGMLARYFPAPYHYLYNEEFSSNYAFSPPNDWLDATSSVEEDIYGAKIISSQFQPFVGNTTLTYDVAYTLQNNTNIRENSAGFADLTSLIAANSDLNNRYLQLPADYSSNSPYTTQIAASLLIPSNTIYNQAFRNLFWLSTNCSYDLDMLFGLSDDSPALGQDYVEWFLLRRMGTAAHFAAAMTILCRLQGIPSRIVVGFSYGEPEGVEHVIKAKHVHSWVEVFVPFSDTEGHWIAFDPSPLLPGLRDEFGANTIGSDIVFYCSNEFFQPPHLYPNPSPPPYFVPNPLSSAWYVDPYNPSNWYGPYVNKTQEFTIFGLLANGKNSDLFIYLLTGDRGDLSFIEGETIKFYDTTANIFLGQAITNSDGLAIINYSYPLSATIGQHFIVAEWSVIQTPTYNLLNLPSLEITGVIVTALVNISSIAPITYFSSIEWTELQLLNILIQYFADEHTIHQMIFLEKIKTVLSEIISFNRAN